MHSKRTEAIQDALAALVRDCLAMDLRALGENADFFSYDPLIAESFTRTHTLPMLDAVAASDLSAAEVGKSLHNPSAIRSMYFFDILMAKCARVGKETYMRIFEFYDDVLAAVCVEDRFAKEFKNKIHSIEEIDALVAKCQPANREIARALGKLGNACYSLSHAAYSDMNPQLVYDNFGPHHQNDTQLFALKIFHNLKPVDIWPETATLPVENIDVGVVLTDVGMKVDSITHAIYEGNQVDGMTGYFAEADGKTLSLTDIEALCERLEDMAVSLYEQVQRSDTETKKQRYCYQKCWGYKALFERLGLDWKPSQEVLYAMKGQHVFDKWNIPEGKEVDIMTTILDPRVDIPHDVIRA